MRTSSRPRAGRGRHAAAALLCAAVAAGAAACGPSPDDAKAAGSPAEPTGSARAKASGPFGELTGSQIVDKAFAATRAAKSLTLDIDLRSADEPTKGYLSLDSRGKCVGTLSLGTASTAELLKADDRDVYLRFDEAFLREQVKEESPEQQEATLDQFRGRWTKMPLSDPDAEDMTALCDLESLLSSFDGGASGIVKGGETTVGGRKALALTEPAGGGETSTVYVATEGTPYVLRIVTSGGDEPGTITFSRFGRPVVAKAPAAKDVVVTE
ncbi:hypothetical protein AB0424_26785 [Streptomyces sp. NPDC051180]|uniref:hypothetical protein n=1 Tax=Streptomyces sp. NPDC051180 TaxID=3155797 RepID=UPI003450FC74